MSKVKKPEVSAPEGSQVFDAISVGARKIKHYALKLKPAILLKNVGWKKYTPKIEKFEHCHIFHNVDSSGRTQTKCAATGGHYHYVEFTQLPDGKVAAKCGPARHMVDHKMRSGQWRRKESEIEFYDEKSDKTIIDDHTHEMEILYASELEIDGSRSQGIAAITQQLTPPSVPGFQEMGAQ